MKTMKVMCATAVCSLALTAFAYGDQQNVTVTQDAHGNTRVAYMPQKSSESVALFANGRSISRESRDASRDRNTQIVNNPHGQQTLLYTSGE
ncbi:MAG: hypothetical protein M3O82_10330 [Verrucomicrobiota bacterium]|nr:hypothetical protein [Verrucomicrobiota bacterium]